MWCSGAPPDFSSQPLFSPLENDTSNSTLTAVTLCRAVTVSVLFDSFRHSESPSADSQEEQAVPSVLGILGRQR